MEKRNVDQEFRSLYHHVYIQMASDVFDMNKATEPERLMSSYLKHKQLMEMLSMFLEEQIKTALRKETEIISTNTIHRVIHTDNME